MIRHKTNHATSRILQRLMISPGKVVTHEALAFAVYGNEINGGPEDGRGSIAVMICKLRKKLPKDAIQCVYGEGYKLKPGVIPPTEEIDNAQVVLALTAEDERALRVSIRRAKEMRV